MTRELRHPLQTRDGRRPGLARDERGAILVIAAFMGIFLVAALFYLMSVGDAILYRERVQDAADTVVFAGAVYHARGMNVIATLNIVMAALLGVVVAARLVLFINTVAMVIGCGCIPVPFIGGVCGSVCNATAQLQPRLLQLVRTLTRIYNRFGPALSKTQQGVAIAMPWIAEAKAIGVSRQHTPDVRFGAIASASLLPNVPSGKLGLPVKDADESVLCGKVRDGIVDLVLWPVSFVEDPIRGWVANPLGRFVETFCAGGDLVDEEEERRVREDALQRQLDERCDWERDVSNALDWWYWEPHRSVEAYRILFDARQSHRQGDADLTQHPCYGAHSRGLLDRLDDPNGLPDWTWTPEDQRPRRCHFDRAACEARTRVEIERRREQELRERGVPDEQPAEVDSGARRRTTPKVVFDGAKNGNGYFQVLSLVWGNDARARRLAPGVEIAARNGERARDPSFWAKIGFAQAEFYYDTTEPWSEDIATTHAMWNLRWRARLRRVGSGPEHGPLRVPDVVTNSADRMMGEIRARLGEAIGSEGGSAEQEALEEFLRTLVLAEFDGAAAELHERAREVDHAIESRVRNLWNRVLGVH